MVKHRDAKAKGDRGERARRAIRLRRLAWTAFLFVDVALLIGLLVALSAVYLDPRPFWWAQIVAVLLPVLAVLVTFLTALVIWRKRWALLVLHLVLLVWSGIRLGPWERLQPVPEPSPDDLIVMSYNLPRHGDDRDAYMDAVETVLAEETADLIALQKAHSAPPDGDRPGYRALQATVAVERLGYRFYIPADIAPRPDTPHDVRPNTSLGLLVRRSTRGGPFEVLDQEHIHFSSEDPKISDATRVHFRWQEREGIMYIVHLRSYGEDKPWDEETSEFRRRGFYEVYLRQYRHAHRGRANDVDELRRRIDDETLPVIVIGDLNSTPNQRDYRVLAGDRQDAFRIAGRGHGGTWRSDLPLVRIDHILADTAFVVTHARVPDVRLSDHRPIVARLRWRSPESLSD